VKRFLLLIACILLAVAAVFVWKQSRSEEKPAEAKEEESTRVTHDELGHVVVKMDDETQGNSGLLVAKPSAAELSREIRGYGKVVDPAALASIMTELATAQAAATASRAEFVRLKGLQIQGNTSESKLQVAEAAARRDELAVQAAKDHLLLAWGKGIAEQTNLSAFIEPLTLQTAVLIRIDLPIGETLTTAPKSARVVSLNGKAASAEFLGTSANVDPQTLGRGAILLQKPNTLGLMLGEAVTGYLEMSGEPRSGVLIPSTAVVRTEGQGWFYVMNKGSDSFTRLQIPLDHPLQDGWFVEKGVTTNDYVVVTGAQTLLSEELKSLLKAD
jgi:hypothetical protein